MHPGHRGPGVKEQDTLTRLFGQGLLSDAEILSKSLTIRFPKDGFGWKVLGAVYQAQHRYEDSLQATRRAIALLPHDAATYNNLGTSLLRLERLDEAEVNFRKALAITPDYPKALSNLGNLLKSQGKLHQAEACCRRALEIEPRYANALVNLGITLTLLDRLVEAQACYRKALAIEPNWAEAHSNLLYCLSHDVYVEARQLQAEHLAFAEQFEAPLRADWPAHNNNKDPARRLQIGFVSGDLSDHAIANFLEPALRCLADRPEFSLHAYHTQTHEDNVTLRLRNYVSHWRNVAKLSDVALANQIRADDIDILIDLSGHTAHNRLLTFARKPAPVQVSWLGYLGTTGLQSMDYYLCDRFWIPPGELEWQFSEQTVLLPTAITFQPSEFAPPVNPLPALENGFITFGSFNRPNKLNDSVIALWSMLLRDTPNSRMVLGAIPPEQQDALRQSFENEGIGKSRLTFYPRSSFAAYLALHHQLDFCLDTFPYGGGATTAHAAWMGVPTLSLAGETPPSRFGATIMHHLDLDGFIATSIEDFVSKGQYWTEHTPELARIRMEMRDRFKVSALGQPDAFAASFDAALRAMWHRWCSHLPASNIDIDVKPTHRELDAVTHLYSQHRYSEAESLSRLLANRFPAQGEVWKIRGAVLLALGRTEESLAAKVKAVELLPDDHEACFNLAYGYHQQGRLDEAVKGYFLALAIQPNNADTYSNLGDALKMLGHFSESEAYCRQAIALKPDLAFAHNNLGNALHAQDKFDEAQTSYQLALLLKPDWPAAYNNLAIALKDAGFWTEAVDCCRKALAITPDWAAAHSNLIHMMSLDVQIEANQLYSENLAFAEQFETPLRAGWSAHHNTKDPNRRLRIGFVSGDLYNHAVATFLEPLLKFLTQTQALSLHAYCAHSVEDTVTQRLRTYFPYWFDVASLSDAELASKIRADCIDILIDLSGHTAHNRLLTFARKPAPIQASWLGYPGTTGLQSMDYHMRDRFWIPTGELDWQFTEQPAFLPAWAIYQPSEYAPPTNTLPALENGCITFGSFNRPNKLNESVIALWSMLLRDIPNARMVLGAIPAEHQDRLLQSFAQQGIEPSRLAFFPRSNMRDYLTLHHQVDICLDTFPYGGGTTTLHAAWMAVPTLTLAGETPPSRMGSTLMNQLGLPGFIATSIEDFLGKGRYWAEQTSELAMIRLQLRKRFEASALGQPEAFAASFEATLRVMWQRWCNDLPTTVIEEVAHSGIGADALRQNTVRR